MSFAFVTGVQTLALPICTNPLVAKGSRVSEPRFKEALDSIIERGGRVIVIDPRRTETARRDEHWPVRPGGDGWLLAGVSRVIIDENLEDRAFLDAHCSGLPTFVEALRSFDLEDCADQSGVSAADIRRLARDLAAAPSGFIFGRTGT